MREELLELKARVKRNANYNQENFLALALAVLHEIQITPEQASRAITGTVTLKPVADITPETITAATKLIISCPQITLEDLEKEFGCNRYKLYDAIKEADVDNVIYARECSSWIDTILFLNKV